MFHRLLGSLVVIAISLVLTLSALKAETITVTDTLDRKITVPADVKSVLLGFYFEDFYAIGGPDAYERIVAISKSAWHD